MAGGDALDWNVDRCFLDGLERFQWLETIPELPFDHVHEIHNKYQIVHLPVSHAAALAPPY